MNELARRWPDGIEYIGCIDILYIAWQNGVLSEVLHIPDRDLSYYISIKDIGDVPPASHLSTSNTMASLSSTCEL